MRVDSPSLSGKGSRPSRCTSGGGRSHKEIREVASWFMPHSERHRFPRPLLIRIRCPNTSSNVTLWMKSPHEGALTPQLHRPEKPAGSKYNATSGLSPCEQLERQAEFQPHHKTRPDSPVPTLQRPCHRSQKWRGTVRFPPHLEMRPYSPLQRCTRNPEVSLATPKEI